MTGYRDRASLKTYSPPRERCQHRGWDKVIYRSPAAARKAARNSKNRSGVTLYTYECPRCGGWHLTSREQYA